MAVLSVFTIYHKIKSDRARKAEVNRICQIVIEKLQAQKKQFIYDSTGQAKPYLGSIQLRDVLLKGNTNKLKTWKIVANRVESNSNVQTVALEVYGEIMRTWEWIGSVDEF